MCYLIDRITLLVGIACAYSLLLSIIAPGLVSVLSDEKPLATVLRAFVAMFIILLYMLFYVSLPAW